MNILFIHPENQESYPIQIGALAAFLKRHGYNVDYLPLQVSVTVEDSHRALVSATVDEKRPGLIAFSCYETSFSWIKAIAHHVKKTANIPTVIGGYYPTLAPEEVISDRCFDYVCIGEGEFPLLELCQGLEEKRDLLRVKNIWTVDRGVVVRNEIRPLIENLDELPFPDRDIIDTQAQLNRGEIGDRNIKVIASRGCPYNCTYCSNSFFRKLYPNGERYVRMRSVEHLIQELELLKKRFVFDSIGFHDDNLTLYPSWLEKFSRMYKERIDLPFYCASRVERCSDDVLAKLKYAGCSMILFGVESGDEQYRKQHMKRFMTNEQIKKAFRATRRFGIKTWAFNMIGMPFEKRQNVWRTIALNCSIRPSFAMTTIYYPFKGTDMGNICYKNGWVNMQKKERVGTYAFDSILNHPHMPNREIVLYKYLCILTAVGSPIFFRALISRVLGLFGLKGAGVRAEATAGDAAPAERRHQ